jgi:hypothetical protein
MFDATGIAYSRKQINTSYVASSSFLARLCNSIQPGFARGWHVTKIINLIPRNGSHPSLSTLARVWNYSVLDSHLLGVIEIYGVISLLQTFLSNFSHPTERLSYL